MYFAKGRNMNYYTHRVNFDRLYFAKKVCTITSLTLYLQCEIDKPAIEKNGLGSFSLCLSGSVTTAKVG